jgi:phosphonate transport system substrate-binding protein
MTLSRNPMRCGLAIVLALIAATARAGDEQPPLSLGTVAMDIPAVMLQRLRPLADYLSREIGKPVQVRPAANLTRATEDIAKGQVDIAYLTPIAYVKAQKTGNVRIVAKTITKGQKSFRLMLVTRADSPIRQVADLAGKRFAFGDEAALVQRAVVVNAGVRMEQLGSYRYLGHYDNIARGVLNGDFDAGILKDTSAYMWEQQGLRIFHTSPELPPYNIVVGRHVDPTVARAIQDALLQLNPDNDEHRKVIKALDESYDGFAPATDAEYNIIRTLVKPFDKPREPAAGR